ncbi:flagellar hook-length control protein FliK [Methylophilus sp.]|uniref:flagellar hook-length control protein FliK n=1 Tax=Methylophilus sp. TaxID=29541 RepID=UPI004035C151
MAFLNSASLLNLGAADAAKKASGNTPVQESQANQSDEFAQALRKQLQQQANKPASNPATPAVAKNNPPVKETMHAQSAQESAKLAKKDTPKEQTVAKEPAKTGATKADDKNATSDKAVVAKDSVDQEAASTETVAALNEPPIDKKRLTTDLEATDPAAAGLTPWMQTMLAMRQPAEQTGVRDQTALTSVGDEATLQPTELQLDTAATAVTVPADNSAATSVAAEISPQTKTAGTELPAADRPAQFSETLDIAKSVAEAVRETVAADKAVDRAGNIDMQFETANTVTQPAAQALPNSPWLSAAGVAQTSNVLMSQVATPFGNERWQTAMNQHVLNMVGSGDDVASLTLSPPDLGPIQVVLKVDNQSVNTSFITDNPLVRQALEDGMQDLRDRMQSQGLELGNTFVGNGQQAEQHFEQQSARGNGRVAEAGADTESATAPQTAVKTRVARGLVDTFA